MKKQNLILSLSEQPHFVILQYATYCNTRANGFNLQVPFEVWALGEIEHKGICHDLIKTGKAKFIR